LKRTGIRTTDQRLPKPSGAAETGFNNHSGVLWTKTHSRMARRSADGGTIASVSRRHRRNPWRQIGMARVPQRRV
jgi:hypothetical protein